MPEYILKQHGPRDEMRITAASEIEARFYAVQALLSPWAASAGANLIGKLTIKESDESATDIQDPRAVPPPEISPDDG